LALFRELNRRGPTRITSPVYTHLVDMVAQKDYTGQLKTYLQLMEDKNISIEEIGVYDNIIAAFLRREDKANAEKYVDGLNPINLRSRYQKMKNDALSMTQTSKKLES
jgi:hypothetical protein